MPEDFLDTNDFSVPELSALVELTGLLKDADRDGYVPGLLRVHCLGVVCGELSARIGISFEAAMATLGGHALLLRHAEDRPGAGDWMGDAARVLSRISDLIEARGLRHQAVLDLATQASVPVINAMSDYNHPSQALADLFTMTEHHPGDGGRGAPPWYSPGTRRTSAAR
jgi:putrescine carbamoyltransferase